MNAPERTSPSVAVVGGGVAGLAAAMRLGEAGFAPTVLEAESRPGGMARCLVFDGISTDMGPHRLHTELPEVRELVSDVCASALFPVRRRSRMLIRGRLVEYPPRPLELLGALGPVLPAKFAAGMAIEAFRPAPRVETYESLMRRAFGSPLYEFLLRPYSAKVWKTDPAEIHADTARVRVSAGSLAKMVKGFLAGEKQGSETALKEFRYVRGGVETMVRLLAERAMRAGTTILTSAPVRGIAVESVARDGAPVRLRATGVVHDGAGANPLPADATISTAPLPILLGNLLPPLPELAGAREAAAGLTYLNVVFVLVVVERRSVTGDNWLYFPEKEWIFNRAYEAKSFDPAMGPDDRAILCVEITTRPGDALDRETDAALAEETLAQLRRAGILAAGEPAKSTVHRLGYGYPLYSLDYAERLDACLAGLGRIENLITTGRQGLFNHNNTDHSIFMGLRAADAAIEARESGFARLAENWNRAADRFKRFRIVD